VYYDKLMWCKRVYDVICREFSTVEVDVYNRLNSVEPVVLPDEVVLLTLLFFWICSVFILFTVQLYCKFCCLCYSSSGVSMKAIYLCCQETADVSIDSLSEKFINSLQSRQDTTVPTVCR